MWRRTYSCKWILTFKSVHGAVWHFVIYPHTLLLYFHRTVTFLRGSWKKNCGSCMVERSKPPFCSPPFLQLHGFCLEIFVSFSNSFRPILLYSSLIASFSFCNDVPFLVPSSSPRIFFHILLDVSLMTSLLKSWTLAAWNGLVFCAGC